MTSVALPAPPARVSRRRRLRHALAATALAAVAAAAWGGAPAAAASLPAATTAILSGAPSLLASLPAPVGSASADSWSVSQDGRSVAFTSTSDGLSDADDDRVSNVYVKDRATGAVTLASRATGAAGEPAHADCDQAAISDDGARVAFACEGALDPADTNRLDDIYLRDLASGTTVLVSRRSGAGPAAEGGSRFPALSATGEYVAFDSEARNLDPAYAGGGTQVYRRRIGGGDAVVVVSRRSQASGGIPVGGTEPSISDDGARVAFTHYPAVEVDPADTNGVSDVYVHDLATGATILASRAAGNGAVGNRGSRAPALSGDGSAVAFESEANNFDFGQDPDTGPDIYRRTVVGATTTQNTVLVDVNAGGAKGVSSRRPSIDDSGNVVGFVSAATGLDPADTDPSADAYVKNLATNVTHLVTRADGAGGAAANADARAVSVSGDGTKAAAAITNGRIVPDVEPRAGTVMLRDLAAARTFSVARPPGDAPFVNAGGFAGSPALSADGRYAAFASSAVALGLPGGAATGIFVRDRVTGLARFVSQADGPSGAPFPDATQPAISADGGRVAFVVRDGALPAAVWVRDLDAARTFLASRADGAAGAPGNGDSDSPALDADGSRVAFVSRASNLGDGDPDAAADVHVRDVAAGATVLASRADGAAGAKGDGPSYGPDLNAEGNRASFVSQARNLADGDTDAIADAHVRDLAAGTTRLASAAPDGTKSNGQTSRAAIDAAGTRVAFSTAATNLLGLTAPLHQAFVRDLRAGTLVLASRADGAAGAPADAGVSNLGLSPDGGYVSFSTSAANLAPGTPAGVIQTYRRDLAAGRTDLVSRRSGAGGAPADQRADAGDISAGGGCVTFTTSDPLVGPAGTLLQAYVRALRADCAAGANAGGGRDTAAPVLTAARLSPRRFRVGRSATAVAAGVRRGTVLRYRSSEAATLTLLVERAGPGRRAAGTRRTCRAVARRPRTRACTAYRRAGVLTRRIRAGTGRTALSGRIGRRRLAAGSYRLTLTARDAAGNRSRPVRLAFTVVHG